jgi:hypothetical protein
VLIAATLALALALVSLSHPAHADAVGELTFAEG